MNIKRTIVLALAASALSVSALAAETFVPARIVDVQSVSAMKADTTARVLGGSSAAVAQDNYLQIVFESADRLVTARTFAMGGGTLWAMNHPEALLVGSDVSIAFAKRGVLLVQVPGKELKLSIQRMEIVTAAQ